METSSSSTRPAATATEADLEAFEHILLSMGIDEFEPNVLVALNEYAKSKTTISRGRQGHVIILLLVGMYRVHRGIIA
jgi:hypothetical protein